MLILAVETSTEYCSVALATEETVTSVCRQVGQQHSSAIMPMIDQVLTQQGVTAAELDGIAYGKGPGSFTGVRIACGVTQGLALAHSLPVVGICTLQALAHDSGHANVLAVLDARMNQVYLAAYRRCASGGDWETVVAPCLSAPDTLPSLPGQGWYGAGSGFKVLTEPLLQHASLCGYEAAAVPQASAVAALAWPLFKHGRTDDAAAAVPLYLRDKVALKTHERTPR